MNQTENLFLYLKVLRMALMVPIKRWRVIPIFGEEIVITKRKIKVGELGIKKNRVTVRNKIEINIKKEEVTVKRPEVIKPGIDDI
jgi:stress response protein YsnF